MIGLSRLHLLAIYVLATQLAMFSMLAQAGNKNSGGSMGQGQKDDSQMWLKQQGMSNPGKKQKNNVQKQNQIQNQTQSRKTIRQLLRDDEIYGHQMMTAREMERYRSRLNAAANDREWARLRAEHQRQMQQRALERGVRMDPPVYGQHMLTREEHYRYNHRMMMATSDTERNRIRNEHRLMIERRSRELGIKVPPGEDI